MIVCEICHEPINNPTCIVIPCTKRCMHISCFGELIREAFFGVIGTEDDEIDGLVADACVDALTDHKPADESGVLDYV